MNAPDELELHAYCQHLSSCKKLRCGTCQGFRADEIHYNGTVDSHVYVPQTDCTCGLDRALQGMRQVRPATAY
jgi:hypothetical protein